MFVCFFFFLLLKFANSVINFDFFGENVIVAMKRPRSQSNETNFNISPKQKRQMRTQTIFVFLQLLFRFLCFLYNMAFTIYHLPYPHLHILAICMNIILIIFQFYYQLFKTKCISMYHYYAYYGLRHAFAYSKYRLCYFCLVIADIHIFPPPVSMQMLNVCTSFSHFACSKTQFQILGISPVHCSHANCMLTSFQLISEIDYS